MTTLFTLLAVSLAWVFTAWWSKKPQKEELNNEMEYLPSVEPLQEPQNEPVSVVQIPITPTTMTNSDKLYETAKSSLGKDMSPQDLAPDSLACMESLDGVFCKAFGAHLLALPGRLSTEAGYNSMLKDTRLEVIKVPEPGCIVISPTGFSAKGAQHGHCGVWGKFDVMSNDSSTGLWTDNYTHEAWYTVFNKTLGFPVVFFKIIG